MIYLFETLQLRRPQYGGLLSIIIVFLITLSQGGLGGNWSINGGVQYLNGNYIYTTSTSTYYLTGGVRYQSDRWNAGVNLPVIAQNNDLVSGSGGIFLPSGHNHNGQTGDGMGGGNYGGGMMGGGRVVTDDVVSHVEFGLGDVYLTGQYQVVTDRDSRPMLGVSAQIKFPTASEERNYGTGEFDYGVTINLVKRWNNYAGFLDVGYWILGDNPEVNYKNPFAYAFGMGRFFNNRKFSALLYYQGYSTILENYDPPRQGSLGLYYRVNDQLVLSAIAMTGFSNTSSDFGLSAGFNLSL